MKDKNSQPNGSPDIDTLTAIFDRYAPPLYKYALLLCHDSRLADYIVGNAFADLLEQFVMSKDPRPDVRSFLYQDAYNFAVKKLRESPQKPSIEPVVAASDILDTSSSQLPDDAPRMEEAMFSTLSNEFTEDQRHVIILYFLEDFSLRDTAKILGKKVGEIQSSLKNIRKIMENHPAGSLAALLNKKKKGRKPK
jgi:RNA polymerase sigma factor (sigma-70 family)